MASRSSLSSFLKKTVFATAIVFVALHGVLYAAVNHWLSGHRASFVASLGEAFGRPVTVERLRYAPIGGFVLEGVGMASPTGDPLEFAEPGGQGVAQVVEGNRLEVALCQCLFQLPQALHLAHTQVRRASAAQAAELDRALRLTDGECELHEYAAIAAVHRQMAEAGGQATVNGTVGELCRGYWWDLLPRGGRSPLGPGQQWPLTRRGAASLASPRAGLRIELGLQVPSAAPRLTARDSRPAGTTGERASHRQRGRLQAGLRRP